MYEDGAVTGRRRVRHGALNEKKEGGKRKEEKRDFTAPPFISSSSALAPFVSLSLVYLHLAHQGNSAQNFEYDKHLYCNYRYVF